MEINATLLGQLITFAFLVWFTMKFVWPPITNVMREREKKIAAGLADAERGKRELDQAQHKALSIIGSAKEEASRIVDQAHKRGAQMVEEAKDNAREEGNRIIARAQEEIALEVTQVKDALRKQLTALAVLGAEKIIQRNINASDQAALLDEFAAEI